MTTEGPTPPGWGGPPPDPHPAAGDEAGPYGLPSPTDPAAYAAEHHDQHGETPRLAGAHRAPPSRSSRTGAYVLIALLVALALLALGLGVKGWLDGSSGGPAAGPSNTQVHVPTASSTAVPTSASPTPTPSVTPTPSATPTPSVRPSSPRPTTSPKPAPPPVVHAPVVVLNETRVTGLAARTAAHLRALGWTVTGIGNWRGEIPTTTVYFAPGLEAAARRLAYDLRVSRVRPRVPGMLTDRLTVVLRPDP